MVDVAGTREGPTTSSGASASSASANGSGGRNGSANGEAKGTGAGGGAASDESPALRVLEARAKHARAAERTVRALTLFLAVGLLGVVLMLGGLAWDAVIHGRNPDPAHLERSVFSLSNPGHLMLLLGGGLAAASVTTALARALALSRIRLLASRPTRTALVGAVLVAAVATGRTLEWAANAELPVASGPLAPPAGPENHGIGVINSHAPGECRPTKAQKAAAAKLIADTKAATARYARVEAAVADGYVGPTSPIPPGATEHYSSAANVLDGKVLDPTRPESLLYTFTSRGPVLVGVMYLTNLPGEFGPEIGGCLTRWHVHTNVCWSMATFQPVNQLAAGETCATGTFPYIPPPALHVWLVDVPGGRFAAEVEAGALVRAAGP